MRKRLLKALFLFGRKLMAKADRQRNSLTFYTSIVNKNTRETA